MFENNNTYQKTQLDNYTVEKDNVENEITVLKDQPAGYVPIYIDEQPQSEGKKIKRLNASIIAVLLVLITGLIFDLMWVNVHGMYQVSKAREEAEKTKYVSSIVYDSEMSLTIDGENIYLPAKYSEIREQLEEMGFEYSYVNYEIDAKTELEQYQNEVFYYEKTDSATGDHTEITLSVSNDEEMTMDAEDCEVIGIYANSNYEVISTEYGFSNALTEDEIMDIIKENNLEYEKNEYSSFTYYDIKINTEDYYKTITLELYNDDYMDNELIVYCID